MSVCWKVKYHDLNVLLLSDNFIHLYGSPEQLDNFPWQWPKSDFFFQVGIFLRRTLQFHFFLFRKTMKRTLTLSLLTSALIVGTIRNTSSFHFNFIAFRNHFLVSAYHINAFLLNNSHWKFPHWKGKMLESRITFVLKLLILLEYVCFGKI